MKTKTKKIYHCESCGFQSESKSEVVVHESNCAKIKEGLKEEVEARKSFANNIQTAESLEELAGIYSDFLTKRAKKECVFKFSQGYIHEKCSNSHSSPRGKPTNWDRKDSLPLGYAGWFGNVEIHIEGGYCYFVSGAWNNIRRFTFLNTGCGGSTDFGLQYNCTLWADDFEVLGKKMYKILDARQINIQQEAYFEQKAFNWAHLREVYVSKQAEVQEIYRQIADLKTKLTKVKKQYSKDFEAANTRPSLPADFISKDDINRMTQDFRGV